MSDSPIISVKPIIHYPRQAQVGKTYVMTVDLQTDEGFDWKYEEEEYPIYCVVESDSFKSKAVGEPTIVVHRFGGTYGAARFLLTTLDNVGESEIKIGLINAWGVSIKVLNSRVKIVALVEEAIDQEPSMDQSWLHTTYKLRQLASNTERGILGQSIQPKKSSSLLRLSSPKVFISYSHDSKAHEDQVLELADRLRREGIDCNIDQYEQSPIEGWHHWAQNEINKADFVLVVSTREYRVAFNNRLSEKSRIAIWKGNIITRELYDLQGHNSKFIPIVFTSEDVKYVLDFLQNAIYYQLQNDDEYELLYRQLTGQYETLKPDLGELKKLPMRGRKQVFSTQVSENLPYQSYDKFIGREAEIEKLLERISPRYGQFISVVTGIGGVGKTALVIEVAYRCLSAKTNNLASSMIPTFDAIIFTSSKSNDWLATKLLDRPRKESTLLDIFREIAETLNEPIITQVPEKQQEEQVRTALKNKSALLIVDNMETLLEEEHDKILEFLNNVPPPTQVIITTRDHLGFPKILLSQLGQEESHSLLEAQAQEKKITLTEYNKNQIFKRFEGIPIAMIYAVGQRAEGYSFADILKPTISINTDLGKFCFDSSITPLRGSSAYKLLIATTFFRRSPSREALVKVAGLVDGTQEVRDGLAKLQKLSLITEQDDRYVILSITREYVLDELAQHTDPDFQEKMKDRRFDWYLDFTKKYGGKDWENWRSKYDHLEEEWTNIEAILYYYAALAEWDKVLDIWQNIDGYVDLNRYWQKRRHWWSKLEQKIADPEIKIKALSERAWTSILMGDEHHEEAEDCLKRAWRMRKPANTVIQASIARHLAILEKGRGNYDEAEKWLSQEMKLVKAFPENKDYLIRKVKIRHTIKNLYYRAEICSLRGHVEQAKKQFEEVTVLCKDAGWQRFQNYAQNNLAEIFIQEMNLEAAEELLMTGLYFAESMREQRRIALYHASYARFYYQMGEISDQANDCKLKAQAYATKANIIFKKEHMNIEQEQIETLMHRIEANWNESMS
jgi:SEFIR domain/NB-ARC domain